MKTPAFFVLWEVKGLLEEFENYALDRDEAEVIALARTHRGGYCPEYPQRVEQEEVVCKESDRCIGCPYPNHGFVCWGSDGSCMRSTIARINDIKEAEGTDESCAVQ